jgi:hypothetical protein
MSIFVRNEGAYIRVIAHTDVVDEPFLYRLIEAMANLVDKPGEINLCLEVISPAIDLEMMATMGICQHAIASNLYRAHIAYVISGRAIDRRVTFVENYANNRGLCLRFFQKKKDAVAWLGSTQNCAAMRWRDAMVA